MKIRILPSKIIPLMYYVRILRIQLLALIMSGCVSIQSMVTASIPSSRHGVVYNYDEYYIYGGEVYYYTPYSVPPYSHIRSTYRVPVYYPHKSYAVRRYKVHSTRPNTGTKYEGTKYGDKQYEGKHYEGKQYGGGNSSGRRK